jgi:hypothetical protein
MTQSVDIEDPITGAVYIQENFLILQVTEVDFHRNLVFQQNGSPPHFNDDVPHFLTSAPRSANGASCLNFVAAFVGRHTVGLLLLELYVPVSATKSNWKLSVCVSPPPPGVMVFSNVHLSKLSSCISSGPTQHKFLPITTVVHASADLLVWRCGPL